MLKILLDTLGMDRGYKEVVKAGVNSVNNDVEIQVTFLGKKENIEKELLNYNFDKKRIFVINAPEEINCNDIPSKAIKEKTESSLVVGLNELKNGYDALISGGSTGAVLMGGFLKIGRIKGVSRPALCPILPTINDRKVMLIDCGANVDPKPVNLCHFALMGSIYMSKILGINNPKVSLLNIGEEENKGSELCRETYSLLKDMPINFVGNIEARDFLSGKTDIVVSDAFSGNILLKGTEGAVMMVLSKLKQEIKSSFLAKIGYLFMKKSFKKLKGALNINGQGGSLFLGLKKTLIKVHGSGTSEAIENAILQAKEIKDKKIIEIFEEEFSRVQIEGKNE